MAKKAVAKAETRGRPTKYDPKMLPKIERLARGGASKSEMAVAIGISRETWYEWAATRSDFADAVKRAEALSQAWWEKKGREATFKSKGFSAISYIFQMKNRFPDDWRDRQQVQAEISGPNGGPIEGTRVISIRDLPAEEREQLRLILLGTKRRGLVTDVEEESDDG